MNRVVAWFSCGAASAVAAKLVWYKGCRIFLDELPSKADDGIIEDISCGPECGVQEEDVIETTS